MFTRTVTETIRTVLGSHVGDWLHLRDDIIRYRLTPSELNTMLRKLASEKNSNEPISGFHAVTSLGERFVICPMSKDSGTAENEPNLPFFIETIAKFYNDDTDRECVLLLPLRMCRHYLKMPPTFAMFKRKHAVLLEINLKEKLIQVHDSQGSFRSVFYPDKIAEALAELNQRVQDKFEYDPRMDYHAYDRQIDDYSCGYFVWRYVQSILKFGTATKCDEISFTISSDYQSKEDFFRRNGIFEFDMVDIVVREFDDVLDEGDQTPVSSSQFTLFSSQGSSLTSSDVIASEQELGNLSTKPR